MQPVKHHVLVSAVACAAAAAALTPAAHAYTTVTQSFQRGTTAGLTETDRRFGSDAPDAIGGSGSTGLDSDGWDPDRQVFLRFDNLIGAGANQIPSGAFIIDATLTVTTNDANNSQTGGFFGVSAVLRPWSNNTTTGSTYNSLSLKPVGTVPTNGTLYPSGAVSRAVGSYADPIPYYGGNGPIEQLGKVTANVTPIVNAWTAGTYANNGFSINAGTPQVTTDGWNIRTSTHATVTDRPLLNVTYTTAPVTTSRFQQGVNGYTSTTMIHLTEDNQTANGASLDHGFIDGWKFSPVPEDSSPDDRALIKFGKIFTSEGGSVPKTARVVKAYLKVTTSDVGNAQTEHPFEVHQMTADWDTNSYYTQFDPYGPRPGVHETDALSRNAGMITNQDVYFDVTPAVTSWQNGAPNRGFDIRGYEDGTFNNDGGTNDGWSIYFTGAVDPSVRPEFLVSWTPRLPGDANEDGKIGPDDFILTDRGFATQRTGWNNGDFNMDGVVNAADYLILDQGFVAQGGYIPEPSFLAMREAQFGASYVASLMASVPEPTSLSLLALAATQLLSRRRRA